jgi:hypothetical protein
MLLYSRAFRSTGQFMCLFGGSLEVVILPLRLSEGLVALSSDSLRAEN